MSDSAQLEAITQAIEPIMSAASTELVELSMRHQSGQTVVRLLVDKVGGVNIADCARLNRQIGEAIDQAHLIEERYTLEVSSPGLDRPLTSKRDFERALGEDVELEERCEDQSGTPSSRQVKGTLLAVQHEAVVVITSSGNVTIPFERIQRARKALKW